MHSIKYSNQAEIDLYDVLDYIAKNSKTNAINYLSKFEDEIELLQLNPYMGTDCKNKLINRDCRMLMFESYIIIYQVNIDLKEIFIVRIFHGSANYTDKI